jgi:galactose-1-phosphate uridylyltransferase
VRGFSDLVHACHAAAGNQISSNEEWYYTPVDSIYKMPWHILIKWRLNVTAGFEGGTKIYINPISPVDLRDKVVPRLYKLRDEGKIAGIRIAEECRIVHNPLKYYKS